VFRRSPALDGVAHALEGTSIKLGGQNMHPEKSGAFTGEISAEMLRAILRRSSSSATASAGVLRRDRRLHQPEGARRAPEPAPADPLVGETLAERDAGSALKVVQSSSKPDSPE